MDKAELFLRKPDLLQALKDEEIAFELAKKSANMSEYEPTSGNVLKAQDCFQASARFLAEIEKAEYQDFERAAECLRRVRVLLEHLSLGKMMEPIKLATYSDGGSWWPAERKCIAVAVFYIDAVRNGEISDKAFNKTIREAYSVDARTVRRWCERADQICEGVQRPLPDHLLSAVKNMGARYKAARSGRKAAPE
ncbi:MAG: hypothetical protein AAFP85_11010 [Pseudomonadota bacterium]